MTETIKISMSREEFVKKPEEERDWILFTAISQINECGCNWARKTNWIRKAYIIAAAAGVVGGAIAMLCKWSVH